MDFVYDLTEKLQDQRIEYFLVTVRKGKVKVNIKIRHCLRSQWSWISCKRLFKINIISR